MERAIIDDPVFPPDFLGDARGTIVDAPRNIRIESLTVEGMAKNRLRIRMLLKIHTVRARLNAHANSIAVEEEPREV